MRKHLIPTVLIFILATGCALLDVRSDSGTEPEGFSAEELERDPVAAMALKYRLPSSESPTSLNPSPEDPSPEVLRLQRARESRELVIGMAMPDVQALWGQPQDVQSAGSPDLGFERWIYFEGLSTSWSLSRYRIVYFEQGQVAGWETTD